MVTFTCNACGESVKKNKVEAHYTRQCPDCYILSCMDCGTDFHGDEYKQHISCVSEAQKYQGALYDPTKEGTSKSKGAVKQASWLETLDAIIESAKVKTPHHQQYFKKMAAYPNVPRNQSKFRRFCANSLKIWKESLADELFNAIKNFHSKTSLASTKETTSSHQNGPTDLTAGTCSQGQDCDISNKEENSGNVTLPNSKEQSHCNDFNNEKKKNKKKKKTKEDSKITSNVVDASSNHSSVDSASNQDKRPKDIKRSSSDKQKKKSKQKESVSASNKNESQQDTSKDVNRKSKRKKVKEENLSIMRGKKDASTSQTIATDDIHGITSECDNKHTTWIEHLDALCQERNLPRFMSVSGVSAKARSQENGMINEKEENASNSDLRTASESNPITTTLEDVTKKSKKKKKKTKQKLYKNVKEKSSLKRASNEACDEHNAKKTKQK